MAIKHKGRAAEIAFGQVFWCDEEISHAGISPHQFACIVWGGVYFCTEWVEEKKRRKSLWGVGLSKAGAGKNLHQLLLWFDKKCVIFCTELSAD